MNIQAHFHPDEHPFVDRAMEWIDKADKQHTIKLTDFLDPRQAFILTSLAGRASDVHIRFDGGYEGAERRRAVIAPSYAYLDDYDMGLCVLSVNLVANRAEKLDHGDYMGAILGLGIKRDKIGDIHVNPSGCHCLAAVEMVQYLDTQLGQVHREKVQTEVLPLSLLQTPAVKLEEVQLSVASMRLDGIASDAFRLSRAKILPAIKAGKCRVNWKVEENPAKAVQDGDMISIQGLGRFKVQEVEGMTKKGRIRVKIGKFV